MFGLFKKAETVSLEEHQAIVRMMYTRLDRAAEHLRTARAEAEANKADADKYRRSRANLALGTAASAAKRKAAANG